MMQSNKVMFRNLWFIFLSTNVTRRVIIRVTLCTKIPNRVFKQTECKYWICNIQVHWFFNVFVVIVIVGIVVVIRVVLGINNYCCSFGHTIWAISHVVIEVLVVHVQFCCVPIRSWPRWIKFIKRFVSRYTLWHCNSDCRNLLIIHICQVQKFRCIRKTN